MVNKNISDNSIEVGNAYLIIDKNKEYFEDLSKIVFNKKVPKKSFGTLNN